MPGYSIAMTHAPLDDDAIARIGTGLIAMTLPKAEWTHAAHFAATLWLLRHRPDPAAEQAMPGLIRAYNESVGGVNSDTAGYHETITQASIAGARAVMAAHPADRALSALLARLLDTELGDRDWPLAYWTRDTLFSVAARRGWVAPDIAPPPWPINPRSA